MVLTMGGHSFYEFFAGGGMARAGLGEDWRCLFANDFDPKKARTYVENWGGEQLFVGDVAAIAAFEVPGNADLAWASFPCQDLSLAGVGGGLRGERSGAFWPFWRLMMQLRRDGRAPRTIVLENVCGLLTSHGGDDFVTLCREVSNGGYRFGAVVIDAIHFVPQSRPRLFVVGFAEQLDVPASQIGIGPSTLWHSSALLEAYHRLPTALQSRWLWFKFPPPATPNSRLLDIIEDAPLGVEWHTTAETQRLLEMMNPVNRAKVQAACSGGGLAVGAVYKRTRWEDGRKVQRAEVRFDNVAGCLRTPGGGSSRQVIMIVNRDKVRTRLLSPRETARLMGLPDEYMLPKRYNDAYHLTGDGVAVPVVRFLAEELLEPVLTYAARPTLVAAE